MELCVILTLIHVLLLGSLPHLILVLYTGFHKGNCCIRSISRGVVAKVCLNELMLGGMVRTRDTVFE